MQELLTTIIPGIVTGIIGAIGGGWWMLRRRSAQLRSQLASDEWDNVGDMVDSYILRLRKMSEEYSQLYQELVDIRAERADEKAANQQLREENRALKDEVLRLKADKQ